MKRDKKYGKKEVYTHLTGMNSSLDPNDLSVHAGSPVLGENAHSTHWTQDALSQSPATSGTKENTPDQ